jgi:hypothetical protein
MVKGIEAPPNPADAAAAAISRAAQMQGESAGIDAPSVVLRMAMTLSSPPRLDR